MGPAGVHPYPHLSRKERRNVFLNVLDRFPAFIALFIFYFNRRCGLLYFFALCAFGVVLGGNLAGNGHVAVLVYDLARYLNAVLVIYKTLEVTAVNFFSGHFREGAARGGQAQQ